MKASKQQIKQMITTGMTIAAENVALTQALIKTVKPIVEAYENEILKRYQFTNKGDVAICERAGFKQEVRVIEDRESAWLMGDEDFKIFEKERKEACKKSGLKVEDEDYCPLLVAEDMNRKANAVFIDSMEPITKMNYDMILGSEDSIGNIKKCVDLGMGLIASLGLLRNANEIMKK